MDFYPLFNEGDVALAGTLSVTASGIPGWWDPWHNETCDAEIVEPRTSQTDRAGNRPHADISTPPSMATVIAMTAIAHTNA